MIIVRLQGGLGNQLFQYAMGRALAERHQTELKLDVSWYQTMPIAAELKQFARPLELRQFQVRFAEASEREISRLRGRFWKRTPVQYKLRQLFELGGQYNRSYVYEDVEILDPRCLRLSDNVYLDGYWQSPYYFRDVECLLRKEFRFADDTVSERAEAFLEPLRAEGSPLVAVHVRRGDLAYAHEVLKNPSLMYGPPTTAEYFSAAMDLFPRESTFLVFSDGARDLDWCRANLRAERMVFVEGNSPIQDFAVMQRCDHNIISNSTFSWWAAWLNESPRKRVVAPRRWFHDNGSIVAPLECLIPREWTLI